MEQVLDVLRGAAPSLNFQKYFLFEDVVRYLGQIIKPGRLEIDNANVATWNRWKRREHWPTCGYFEFWECTSSLCSFFHSNCETYPQTSSRAEKAGNLPELAEEQLKIFRELIESVTSLEVLPLTKRGLRYSLDMGSRNQQTRYALFQIQEDNTREPVGFWTGWLTANEMKYGISEKEYLEMVLCITTSILIISAFDGWWNPLTRVVD